MTIIDELILNYIFIFILFEFYEISWQRAPSIMGMIIIMHKYYAKSIFLFLVMQPTFMFAIGFFIITNYNIYATLLLFIKAIDIITKIFLIEQVFVKRKLSQDLSLILLAPINGFLPYIGLALYPILIFLAI